MIRVRQEVDTVDLNRIAYVYAGFDCNIDAMRSEAVKQGHRIPCKKGCDACCYDVALCSQFEIPPIVEAIRKMSTEEQDLIRLQLKEWCVGLSEKAIPLDSDQLEVELYNKPPRIACPLLNKDTHECRAYERRPLACRGHVLANMDPDVCANRHNRSEITTIEVTAIVGQAMYGLIQIYAGKKIKEVSVAILMFPAMLLKAWTLVENPESSYVWWLNTIAGGGRLIGR